jgi:outer membrane protein assembly factor BamB
LRQIYCVDAENGALKWTRPMPTAYSVLAVTPTLVGDAVFMTAPHGKGGRLFNVTSGEEVWTSTLDTCQGGVIYTDGKLLGSFYPGRKGWAAVDAKTGEVIYTKDYTKGSAALADGRLYALSEDGLMRLLEPTATEFKTHGEFRLARAQNDAWAHPVILDGRLYLRYHDTLFCYDIKASAR